MIAIGSDHGGFNIKNEIIAYFEENHISYKDFGTVSPKAVDYAPIAAKVARAVASGEFERGILVCGTGLGMAYVANKINGIRAACCSEHFSARYARLHNDANILCLGGRVVGPGTALELVNIFITTGFEGGHHAERVAQIAAVERGEL